MTLEQVKEHFKNAEEVKCAVGGDIQPINLNTIRYFRNSVICTKNKEGSILHVYLFRDSTGELAQITKYKTMKNTTEVSNELIKSYHKDACSEWKKRIENDFPELFPKLELEVGKWYKGDYERNFKLFCYQGDSSYGFGGLGIWSEDLITSRVDINEYQPATDEEVEKALIDEAERRGFKVGVKVITTGGYKSIITDGHNHKFRAKDNNFYFHNLRVFDNGKWATIIQPEKEIEVDGFTYVLKA